MVIVEQGRLLFFRSHGAALHFGVRRFGLDPDHFEGVPVLQAVAEDFPFFLAFAVELGGVLGDLLLLFNETLV